VIQVRLTGTAGGLPAVWLRRAHAGGATVRVQRTDAETVLATEAAVEQITPVARLRPLAGSFAVRRRRKAAAGA
jgi:hypothetical protein